MVLLVSLAFLACAKSAAPETKSWRMFCYVPSTNYWVTDVFKPFASEVEESTKGGLDITVYTAGELPYKGIQLLSAIKNREIEVAEIQPTLEIGEMPQLGIFQYPFITGVVAPQQNIANNKALLEALFPKVEKILNEKFNAHYLTGGCYPSSQMFANKPIRRLADLKGRKIRVVGAHYAEFQNALGGVGVAMATGEVYTALQRGTVEGVGTTYFMQYSAKWYEVANYGLEWNVIGPIDFLVVNRDAWNGLPSDVRKVVESVAKKYSKVWYELTVQRDVEAKQAMIKAGGQFTPLSAEDEKTIMAIVGPLWHKWAKATPDGDEFLEAGLKAMGR